MKTITIEEFKNKIKAGDMYYSINMLNGEHTGWRLYLGNGRSIGLNTECKGSYGDSLILSFITITKAIFINEFISLNKFAEFMYSFNEYKMSDYITYVNVKTEKGVELENLINKLQQQLQEVENKLNKFRSE